MKTENEGVSLMDVGVGSVIFSMGLVAKNSAKSWNKTFRHVLPCILLGLARLYSVKALDYQVSDSLIFQTQPHLSQEHTSEYGVHWNFFFTIAIIPIFVKLTVGRNRMVIGSLITLGIAKLGPGL